MTLYLTPVEVLLMHRVLVGRYGGAQGIRDAGALESALFRPQSGYYDNLVAEAAALFESLLMNHPFADGNKRVAFACLDVFLRVNGHRLEITSRAAHKWIIGQLEKGTCDMATIEPWLRKHVRRAKR